jgi:uncharacterized protein (UPF0303 family)
MLPSTEADLADLAAQEQHLGFARFDHDTAWQLGAQLVEAAREQRLPVVVSISCRGQRMFHAGLPGSEPDNDSWVERKSRAVLRFGHSSLYLGTRARAAGTTFEAAFGVPEAEYAAHGGSFPITVPDDGVIGTITVSGLPQLDDHAFVVTQLERFLAQWNSAL